jgi:hypothetical protein
MSCYSSSELSEKLPLIAACFDASLQAHADAGNAIFLSYRNLSLFEIVLP